MFNIFYIIIYNMIYVSDIHIIHCVLWILDLN